MQANLMVSDKVWPAMSDAFEKTDGSLAQRMLEALKAAQREGGDIRGQQSAAILIVGGKPVYPPWKGIDLSLRVEDHPKPLEELERLIRINTALEHASNSEKAFESKDVEKGNHEYQMAEQLSPQDDEIRFWHAVSLVKVGKVDEAVEIFRYVISKNSSWATLLRRLSTVGLFPVDESLLTKILRLSSA